MAFAIAVKNRSRQVCSVNQCSDGETDDYENCFTAFNHLDIPSGRRKCIADVTEISLIHSAFYSFAPTFTPAKFAMRPRTQPAANKL